MVNNIVVVLLVLVKICHIMNQRGFMLYTTIHTQTFDLSFVHWRLGVWHHFQNISVTTFVAEIGVPRENHRPVASHWKTVIA